MTEQTDLRQLDRALAEALGIEIFHTVTLGQDYWAFGVDGEWRISEAAARADVPPFSADTPEGREAMWDLIGWMRTLGWLLTLIQVRDTHRWIASFVREKAAIIRGYDGYGASAPEAVARAALSAKEAPDA